MTIKESKDLTSLSFDELIGNLKDKDKSSEEESSTSRSEDEEYAMAVRDFNKFFKRRGRCGDPNHLIEECPKPPRDKNQKSFVGGSWSDSGEEDDEKTKDERYLMAHASSERCPGAQLDLSTFPRFVLTCKDMRVLPLNLILTFPSKFWTSLRIPTNFNDRTLNEIHEQELEDRVMARIEQRFDQFVDQLSDQMDQLMNKRSNHNSQGTDDEQSENPFAEDYDASSDEQSG
ncbi:hypothetical protein Tco_0156573 [Tanacetum coccineum]